MFGLKDLKHEISMQAADIRDCILHLKQLQDQFMELSDNICAAIIRMNDLELLIKKNMKEEERKTGRQKK